MMKITDNLHISVVMQAEG